MLDAPVFCRISAGAFLLLGLACGVWKYIEIRRSGESKAPVYVDIAHRAALLYAFACELMANLAEGSAWTNAVNLAASVGAIAFFLLAVLGYVVHGLLGDTDNQLAKPHRLGRRTIPAAAMTTLVVALIISEIGGVLLLFLGYAARHIGAATEIASTFGATQ